MSHKYVAMEFILQDYVYDLLAILDILDPLIIVMKAVQTINCAPWKIVNLMDKLIVHYDLMQFGVHRKTPRSSTHANDLSLEPPMFKGKPVLVAISQIFVENTNLKNTNFC